MDGSLPVESTQIIDFDSIWEGAGETSRHSYIDYSAMVSCSRFI